MRRMVHPTLKLMLLLLMLLGLVSILVNASSIQSDFGHCDRVVKRWAFSSLDQEIKEDRHTLRDLLFFLHVPRTGGRTYFHCFLKKLYNNLECPRSYDKLRFDPSKPKCRLLVTHDDYSMMSKLPSQRTSVVTILRNPVDRVFSTYEFSIEVAARFLLHPNLSSVIQMSERLRSKTRGVSTLDIWPWKYLVPWMREDLFARVAGLTNNSYLAESHEVRHCVQKYKILGNHVLQVAKNRLDNMLYVGLTEEHKESATMFANVVGAQVISQLRASNTSMKSVSKKKSEQSPSFLDSDPDNNDHQNSSSDQNAGQLASNEDDEATKENMTVEDLMKAYEGCIPSLRKTQAARRTSSLKRISPANFSKEERLQVPEMLLEQIRSLNHLDLELYKYAQEIFEKRRKHTMEKLVTAEMWESMLNNSYSGVLWKVFPLVMTIILLFCLFVLFVNARRRTSKVKI
ncbi:protein-tyrosine sulfotransferase isoform X2 [Castanea sativa]|uniref:protein-tyrosine sulfotransferase isoform X2 n=1 Tax=Castanea sativa TaxID=21020 RepID=UPI003F65283B